MAWLGATPKPPEESKRAPQKQTRLEALKAQKIAPPLPPNPVPHVTDRLMEMGLTQAAGMAAVPLSWQEIDAWCRRTAIDLTPWEARLIRRLSAEYLAESQRAEAETCPPPWRAPVPQHQIDTEVSRLRSVLG